MIDACLASRPASQRTDKEIQISSFAKAFAESIHDCQLKIGQKVEAQIQLVKDYGIIAQIKSDDKAIIQTGFIVNDQRSSDSKAYKQGQLLKCRVLDIDPAKGIADLSEKLGEVKDKRADKEA